MRSYLRQHDHKMAVFSILVEVRRAISKASALDFQRADFELFRSQVGKIPWDSVLKGSRKAVYFLRGKSYRCHKMSHGEGDQCG